MMDDFECDDLVISEYVDQDYGDVTFRGAPDDFGGLDSQLFKSEAEELRIGLPTFNDAAAFGTSLTPPPAPLYLQPFTTFTSQEDAATLLYQCATTISCMADMTVDFLPQPETCSISGVIYNSQGNETQFSLCVYESETTAHLAQVTRTSGDAVVFRAFSDNFSKLNSSPSSSSPDDSITSFPSDPFAFDLSVFGDLPPLPDLPPISAAAEDVENAMSLATSKWVESAREGLSLLVDMTTDESSINEVLASPFLDSLLETHIPSADVPCGRLSSALLLGLLKSPSASHQLKSLTPLLFDCLERKETVFTLQQNRQLSICLESLLATGASQADKLKLQNCSLQLSDAAAKTTLSSLLDSISV